MGYCQSPLMNNVLDIPDAFYSHLEFVRLDVDLLEADGEVGESLAQLLLLLTPQSALSPLGVKLTHSLGQPSLMESCRVMIFLHMIAIFSKNAFSISF